MSGKAREVAGSEIADSLMDEILADSNSPITSTPEKKSEKHCSVTVMQLLGC